MCFISKFYTSFIFFFQPFKGNASIKSVASLDDIVSLPPGLLKYEEDMEDDDDTETGLDAMEDHVGETEGDPATANTIPLAKRRKRKRNFAAHYPLTANYELMELRKKKLQLECAKLELELEKMPLECAKLELEIQKLQRDLLDSNQRIQQQNPL